jgi:hypothetical protein
MLGSPAPIIASQKRKANAKYFSIRDIPVFMIGTEIHSSRTGVFLKLKKGTLPGKVLTQHRVPVPL